MFIASYRNTERGIEARKQVPPPPPDRRLPPSTEIAVLKGRVAALERKLGEMSPPPPVVIEKFWEKHWSETPLFKSKFQRIEARACKLFKIRRIELYSCGRQRRFAFARHFVMYWACRQTTLSLPQIGRLMGGRDHTTVLHGKDKYVEKRRDMGRTLRRAR